MTISSSLNAGVSGLTANATRLAAISDNIANSNTAGYKRADVDFTSLVINQSSTVFSAGGVRSEVFRDVASDGAILATGNALDIAITGRGLIPVTDISGLDTLEVNDRTFNLTPTGSFQPDANGFLRTLSGHFLLGFPTDANGDTGPISRDSTAGLEPVNVNVAQFSAQATTEITLGVNLPATATAPESEVEPIDLPIEYFDNLGSGQNLLINFAPTIDPLGVGNTNQWTLTISDQADGVTNQIGTLVIDFSDASGTGGAVDTVTIPPGSAIAYDQDTGNLSFNVSSGPIEIFIGEPGNVDGLSQFAAEFSPTNIIQDGAPIGEIQDVQITDLGVIEAIYSSGFRRPIYEVPVADVPNPNGLSAESNQAFSLSGDSGSVFLFQAGSGPTGNYQGFALTESSTDIATELTQLIETQRAYSSNATVVTTVDEILQETANL